MAKAGKGSDVIDAEAEQARKRLFASEEIALAAQVHPIAFLHLLIEAGCRTWSSAAELLGVGPGRVKKWVRGEEAIEGESRERVLDLRRLIAARTGGK